MRKYNWLIICSFILASCGGNDKRKDLIDEQNKTAPTSEIPTEVRTRAVRAEVFHYELVSNGTVQAMRKSDLKFQLQEVVSRIYVRNGDRVVKGQPLASLDAFKLQNALAQALDNFERSKLDLQDVLIGQGYSADEAKVPDKVLKVAKVKSNYEQNRINVVNAEYNLKSATLYAPFNGMVANLNTQENNYPDGSKAFCTVVDLNKPMVQFMILESELTMVKRGDDVLVSPFSELGKVLKGVISEVNPIVDQNGMVIVKATVANTENKLFEGMNVRVRVQRAMNRQLVIPKSALVLRNNRKVVFTCKEGLAQWVYVQTGLENSESYTVTEGLQEGDSVIYEGNLNLAHESPILVR